MNQHEHTNNSYNFKQALMLNDIATHELKSIENRNQASLNKESSTAPKPVEHANRQLLNKQ